MGRRRGKGFSRTSAVAMVLLAAVAFALPNGAWAQVPPCDVTASSNSQVCENRTLYLYANGTGTGPLTYSWNGPSGFNSSQQNPTRYPPVAGTYSVLLSASGGCTARSDTSVTLLTIPTVAPTSNSPVCTGQTINLSANATGSPPLAYKWSGPNAYMSTDANPTIANATLAMTGTYSVTVSNTCCGGLPPAPSGDVDPEGCGCCNGVGGSVDVTVNQTPTATAPNVELCEPYTQTDLENAVHNEGGNCSVGTELITDNGNGTYTLSCDNLGCTDSKNGNITAITPDCTMTVDGQTTITVVAPGSSHTAEVPDQGAGFSYAWSVIELTNNTSLINGSSTGYQVNWTAPLVSAEIKISVTVTHDASGCTCTFDPPITTEGSNEGILIVTRYIPTIGGWGLIGLFMLLGGAGAWMVRRRKK